MKIESIVLLVLSITLILVIYFVFINNTIDTSTTPNEYSNRMLLELEKSKSNYTFWNYLHDRYIVSEFLLEQNIDTVPQGYSTIMKNVKRYDKYMVLDYKIREVEYMRDSCDVEYSRNILLYQSENKEDSLSIIKSELYNDFVINILEPFNKKWNKNLFENEKK